MSKANHTYRLALRATHLAIHFLAEDDVDLAAHFGTLTGDDVDKCERVVFDVKAGAIPVLRQVPNWLVAGKVALRDEGGDHVCVSTEPVETQASSGYRPLRLSMVDHLQPGHGNEERHSPPPSGQPSELAAADAPARNPQMRDAALASRLRQSEGAGGAGWSRAAGASSCVS